MQPAVSAVRAAFAAVLLAAIAAALPAAPNAAPGVGQIVDATGPVTVQNGSAAAAPGILMLPLRRGDVLRVGPRGRAEVVLFGNGARFVLGAGSAARVETDRLRRLSGPQPVARPASAVPRLGTRKVSERILGVVTRGSETAVGPRRLFPNGVVRRAGPLTWHGPIPETASELRVRLDDDVETLVDEKLPVSAREFAPPRGTLKPGTTYVWVVAAVAADGEVVGRATAVVRELRPEERRLLERMEQAAERDRRAGSTSPASLLLLAQACEQLGLQDEALSRYREAAKLRPQDAGLQRAIRRLSAPGG